MAESLTEEVLESHRQADKLFLDLQEQILKVRMVPLGPLFRRYIRVVRDLAANSGKLARLVIEDADVEVDNSVMEHPQDPLTHMVRNALDHGIEMPDARRASGKIACGVVTTRAYHEGGNIGIQVADDGSGLDKRRIG